MVKHAFKKARFPLIAGIAIIVIVIVLSASLGLFKAPLKSPVQKDVLGKAYLYDAIISGEKCSDVYDPVCGSDGKTYDNLCLAKKAGTDLEYQGICK